MTELRTRKWRNSCKYLSNLTFQLDVPHFALSQITKINVQSFFTQVYFEEMSTLRWPNAHTVNFIASEERLLCACNEHFIWKISILQMDLSDIRKFLGIIMVKKYGWYS